ncbi:MAG: YfhO family protein, partial [Magnetococcales bacterium]|nr:YfhO family protein [Magnetococcales bacterium]
EPPDTAPAPNLSGGTVTLERYTPDRSVWRVVNHGPALLVVTNNHDPYWRVTVNGAPGSIMPVDHAFQGIALEAGENQVVLEYWPPYRR